MPINPTHNDPFDTTWVRCDHTSDGVNHTCEAAPVVVIMVRNYVSTQWLACATCDDHRSSLLMEGFKAMSVLQSPGWTLIEYDLDADYRILVRS